MAPPVNKPGHPPDVTVLTVSRETDVTSVRRGSREMNVMTVWRGSKELIASFVLWTTMEAIVVKIVYCLLLFL